MLKSNRTYKNTRYHLFSCPETRTCRGTIIPPRCNGLTRYAKGRDSSGTTSAGIRCGTLSNEPLSVTVLGLLTASLQRFVYIFFIIAWNSEKVNPFYKRERDFFRESFAKKGNDFHIYFPFHYQKNNKPYMKRSMACVKMHTIHLWKHLYNDMMMCRRQKSA